MLENILSSNFILSVDTYKFGHYHQQAEGINTSYSVVVPRKAAKDDGFEYDEIVVAGTALFASILENVTITREMIDEAEFEVNSQGYEFNRAGWEHILLAYGGKIPVKVMGVEEGTVVKPQTPIMAIFNIGGEKTNFLPGYLETMAQACTWTMTTTASGMRAARKIVKEFADLTGTPKEAIDYLLHNFGDRASRGPTENAVLSGIAHSFLFNGSDCARANRYIRKIYNYDGVATSSIEATEHATAMTNSDCANKNDFGAAVMFAELLEHVAERSKRGIGIPAASCIIDTYDSRRFVREFCGTTLKDRFLASGAKAVFRPDSGLVTVEPSLVANDICETFGFSVNDKGYKVLHPQTAVIQGDGVKLGTLRMILQAWVNSGYSLESFVLGMGGGIVGFGSRDLNSFSMKLVAILKNGVWTPLLKDPITDSGKKSLTGVVRARYVDGILTTVVEEDIHMEEKGWRCYYNTGTRPYIPVYTEVRKAARIGL